MIESAACPAERRGTRRRKGGGKFPFVNGWQEGYGGFPYNFWDRDIIIEYVKNQKEHHKKESSYYEFKRLLSENGIAFDEKYLL